ncbi:KICSTOR complex protein SZT2 [Ditylenchus destructor]|nr:KICSTOR complex protein SZT2 [Ditylenchus destructor]
MSTIRSKYGQNIARQNIERQSEPNLNRNIASRNGPREAKEVFLFMQRTVRISRNVRARWFLEHLNKPIRATNIDDSSFSNDAGDKTDDYEGLTVVGVVAKDDFASRPDEEFLIVSSTIITYFSKLYRLIFIFDFSPSSFVSDESDESVLYTKLIQSVTKCVRNLTKEFKFPGGASNFKPQLLVTFCAFTPFLCFSEDSVLLQGVLLTEENVEEVLNFLHNRVKEYLNKLCSFTQPHMKEWNNRRRRYRRLHDDVLGNLIQSNSFTDGISIQPKLSNASSQLVTPASTTDRGFIQPDWALIFMLRMGLMAVQMLPENTQSNIVIVTDGVCGIPDNTALQNALSQLRAFTISCSFIQLRQSSMRGPVLGHVGFPELFRFLATATFGSFLSEDELTDETKSIKEYNMYHKSFLAWSFHRGLLRESGPLPDIIPTTLRTLHFRNKELSRTYETSLSKLLYVRLREGYTIKHVEIQKRLDLAEMIVVKLSLAWKPNIFLEYNITSPWNQQDQQKRCKIHVDVYLDAVGNSAMDSCGDRQDPDSVKIMIRNLHNADGLLIHLHIFNTDSHYYTLSKEFDQDIPLFEYKKGSQKPVLSEKYENLKSTKFVQFWHPLCLLDEGIWQKWVHTHSLRLCLAHDLPLPEKIFTPASNKGRFSQLTAEVAFHALHDLLRANATFTLVKDQIYIKMIYENDENVPSYFYLIRSSLEMPFVILKVAFLGGVSGVTRKKVLDNLKELLKDLKIKREIQYISSVAPSITKCFHSNLLLLLRKPMERILVKYRNIPRCLDQIIRLEKSDNLRDNREMILHNAMAKYLTCKRQIWFLREVFLKNPVPSSFTSIRNHFPNSSEATCIEFILQTLLRRRLNQDFSIAYGRNGILNLVRQHEDQTYPFLPKVEQCVIFGPSFADNNTVELNSSLMSREPQQNGGDKTGTMSTLDSSIFQSSLQIWPQLVTEVWTEAQDSTDLEWVDQSKAQTDERLQSCLGRSPQMNPSPPPRIPARVLCINICPRLLSFLWAGLYMGALWTERPQLSSPGWKGLLWFPWLLSPLLSFTYSVRFPFMVFRVFVVQP